MHRITSASTCTADDMSLWGSRTITLASTCAPFYARCGAETAARRPVLAIPQRLQTRQELLPGSLLLSHVAGQAISSPPAGRCCSEATACACSLRSPSPCADLDHCAVGPVIVSSQRCPSRSPSHLSRPIYEGPTGPDVRAELSRSSCAALRQRLPRHRIGRAPLVGVSAGWWPGSPRCCCLANALTHVDSGHWAWRRQVPGKWRTARTELAVH